MFPGRCKATNLCRYCRSIYVSETVQMLTLDAAENAPTVWLVLTAREHLTRKDTYDHLRQMLRAGRKRWPNLEWFVQTEFQRRGALHLNLLLKGVPRDEHDQALAVIGGRWVARVDAEMIGQWSGPVEDGVGTILYISKMLAHGLKAEQAPPIGWKGHRTSQTKGYLVRPASVMRGEAKAAERHRRRIWKAESHAWARASAEADRYHEPESWASTQFLGMLDAEGFVDAWAQEKFEELEELRRAELGTTYRLHHQTDSGRWRPLLPKAKPKGTSGIIRLRSPDRTAQPGGAVTPPGASRGGAAPR